LHAATSPFILAMHAAATIKAMHNSNNNNPQQQQQQQLQQPYC